MQFIRIVSISGSEKLFSSFAVGGFSEMKSDQDSVHLFFKTLSATGPLSPGDTYYGTRVEFDKVGLGYQLFQEITLSLSSLVTSQIVTLDFTSDPLVSLTFTSINN